MRKAMDVAEAVTRAAIDQLETEIEAIEADAFIAGWRALSEIPRVPDDIEIDDFLDNCLDAALDKYMKGQGEA